jgi:hypothetical protein
MVFHWRQGLILLQQSLGNKIENIFRIRADRRIPEQRLPNLRSMIFYVDRRFAPDAYGHQAQQYSSYR